MIDSGARVVLYNDLCRDGATIFYIYIIFWPEKTRNCETS